MEYGRLREIKMRILFMGGHELGKKALESIVKSGRNVIGAVVTDNSNQWYKGVDEVAQKYNIPLYEQANVNSPDFIEVLKGLSPDIITVVNFEQILKQQIIEIPNKSCINTHASLLPAYRGRAPLNWAMINGEKETGVTVHYINNGIDTGNIIIQKSVKIEESDYINDVLEKIKKVYSYIVVEAIELIENNMVKSIKQNLSEGFYCRKRTPADGQIDWRKPIRDIYNLIRAVSKPYPGAYTYYDNSKLIIWRAVIDKEISIDNETNNGKIVETNYNGIVVKTNGGYLKITECESEGNINIKTGSFFGFKEEG